MKFNLYDTLRSPVMVAFGHRRILLSPAGNGFLVTGNAYTIPYRRHGEGGFVADAPLFVFCDPQGQLISEYSIDDVLTEEEIHTGPCPGCECQDVLYVFDQDPSLSANGLFVELGAFHTKRRVTFCLPLGVLIEDKQAFENRLVEIEWERLSEDGRREIRIEIGEQLQLLQSSDSSIAEDARAELLNCGMMALSMVRDARASADSRVAQERLFELEQLLQPWANDGYEQMLVDLTFLTGFVDYSEEAVASAARRRLKELIPDAEPSDWREWLELNRHLLIWDEEAQQYRHD